MHSRREFLKRIGLAAAFVPLVPLDVAANFVGKVAEPVMAGHGTTIEDIISSGRDRRKNVRRCVTSAGVCG